MEEQVNVVVSAQTGNLPGQTGSAAKAIEEMQKRMEASLKQLGADFKSAADGMGQSMSSAATRIEESMTRARKATEESTGQMTKLMWEAYQQLLGFLALNAVKDFVLSTRDAVVQAEASFRGLEAVANFTGVGIGRAYQEASKLAADGLVNIADTSKALQNLLQRGYSLDQSIEVLKRLKDAAAFNRQATLSMSEAVVTATEGLKNENSVLVDNAGVTKNVSVMWKEYATSIGTTMDKLTQSQKIQAEYNGIMRETEAQLGNAEKAANGLQGAAARSDKAFMDMKVTIGEALTPAFNLLYDAMNGVYTFFTRLTQATQIISAAFAAVVIDITNLWSASKNLDFGSLGDKLKANAQQFKDTVDEIINRPAGGTIQPLADSGRRKQEEYTPSSGWKDNMQAWDAGLQHMLSSQQIFGDKAKRVEAQYWQGILDSAKLSTEERMELEKRVYNLKSSLASKAESDSKRNNKVEAAGALEAMNQEIIAAGNNYEEKLRLQNAALAEIKRIYGEQSAQYARMAGQILQTERAMQAQIRDLQLVGVEAARDAASRQLAYEEQVTRIRAGNGELTNRDLLALHQEYENRRYAIEAEALRQRIALAAQDPNANPATLAQLHAQLEGLQQAHANNMSLIMREATAQDSIVGGMMERVESTWSQGLARMLQGQLSFKNAIAGMWQSLKSAFFSVIAEMIVKWAIKETLQTAATATASGTRLAIEAGAAVKSVAIWAAAAIKNIAISAYQAMAAAWAAISGIPYVGPFLAPAVAAATLAGVIAIGSNIASAEGGYNIPAGVNPVTQLHEEEMVLPAEIANPLRQNLADGGGVGGGSGQPIIIQAMDGKDVVRVLRKHGPALVKSLGGQVRNFNTGGN